MSDNTTHLHLAPQRIQPEPRRIHLLTAFIPERKSVADSQRWTVNQTRTIPEFPSPSPSPCLPPLFNDNHLFKDDRKHKFRLFRALKRMIPSRLPPTTSSISPLCGSLADTPTT